MEWFCMWIGLSGLVGAWSRSKGNGFATGFLLSLLLSPIIGAVIVAVQKENRRAIETVALASGDSQRCPACAELVRAEATRCRYCGHLLAGS